MKERVEAYFEDTTRKLYRDAGRREKQSPPGASFSPLPQSIAAGVKARLSVQTSKARRDHSAGLLLRAASQKGELRELFRRAATTTLLIGDSLPRDDAVPFNPPDISERTWLGACIGVGGLLCGLVGVAAVISQDLKILLAVAAGSGWTLSIILAVLYTGHRRRAIELETDLADACRQAAEWSTTANNVSLAARSVIEVVGSAPAPPRRRVRKG